MGELVIEVGYQGPPDAVDIRTSGDEIRVTVHPEPEAEVWQPFAATSSTSAIRSPSLQEMPPSNAEVASTDVMDTRDAAPGESVTTGGCFMLGRPPIALLPRSAGRRCRRTSPMSTATICATSSHGPFIAGVFAHPESVDEDGARLPAPVQQSVRPTPSRPLLHP